MKIRWTQDSVRFRITPSELEALLRGESILETLGSAGESGWSAEIAPQNAPTGIVLQPGKVCVGLSEPDCAALAEPEREGVYFQQEAPSLRYYIEKDFPCAHPRAAEAQERPTETFSPPQKTSWP